MRSVCVCVYVYECMCVYVCVLRKVDHVASVGKLLIMCVG